MTSKEDLHHAHLLDRVVGCNGLSDICIGDQCNVTPRVAMWRYESLLLDGWPRCFGLATSRVNTAPDSTIQYMDFKQII
jgi:hypothetical protein